MDYLFEFTSAVTREFFDLVAQEGVTSYEEDDGKLATLAVKNVLAKRDFTLVQTEHYGRILNRQWLGEPALLQEVRDAYSALLRRDDEGEEDSIAMDAIEEALATRDKLVVSSKHLAELNELAHPDEPPTVIIDKTGAVSFQSEGLVVRDYRKGAVCMACGEFFSFKSLRAVYRVYDSGVAISENRGAGGPDYMCDDCTPEGDNIPF